MQTFVLNLPEDWAVKVNRVLKEEQLSFDALFMKALNNYLYQKNVRKIRRSLRGYAEKAGIRNEEELFEQIS